MTIRGEATEISVPAIRRWVGTHLRSDLDYVARKVPGFGKNNLVKVVCEDAPNIYPEEMIREAVKSMFDGQGNLKPEYVPKTLVADNGTGVTAATSTNITSSGGPTPPPKQNSAVSSDSGPKISSTQAKPAAPVPPPISQPASQPATTIAQISTAEARPAVATQANRATVPASPPKIPNTPAAAVESKTRMNHVDLWSLSDIHPIPRVVPLDSPGKASDQGFKRQLLLRHDVASSSLWEKDGPNHAPLLCENVLDVLNGESKGEAVPQYGLMGTVELPPDPGSWDSSDIETMYLNSNVPFSTFICGLQGGGKSHTLSVLLENLMIPEPLLGNLPKPLSGIVLHYSQFTSSSSFRPCEAAYLGRATSEGNLPLSVKTVRSVKVYVSASNYIQMKKLYTSIANVSVCALRFGSQDLTIGSMLQLMSFHQGQEPPLYMSLVAKILRDMAAEGEGNFRYWEFKRKVIAAEMLPGQRAPLNMRLELLESFVDDDNAHHESLFEAEEGVLSIVDLSCPFVDAETAATLFNIALDAFIGVTNQKRGFVVALDEAHKYLTNKPAATRLTDSLLSLVRQQRHYGARVIISTQEPTVSPKLLDLCGVIIMHRFTSPDWLEVLKKHLSIGTSSGDDEKATSKRIGRLKVGEALIFAPLTLLKDDPDEESSLAGSTAFKLKVRRRITSDGGKSVMAV